MIFLHGLPTSKELWNHVVGNLENYRRINYDLLDFGESEKIGVYITHKERTDVLEELRNNLKIESFILVAHDLGVSVAMDYMGKYGKYVEKLIVMSPPVYPDFVEPFIVKLSRNHLMGRFLIFIMGSMLISIGVKKGLSNKKKYTKEVHRHFSESFKGKEGRAALLRVLNWGRPKNTFADYPEIIKNIAVPTLILQGNNDPYIPEDHAKRMEMDMPNSELVIIQGAHFIPLDSPKDVTRELQRFCD